MNVQAKIVITTVLGDSREVTRYYDNGFDCPYCNYPTQYPKTTCSNPGCEATPGWTVDGLTRVRAERAAEKEKQDRDERNRQWGMKYARERADAHTAWVKEQVDYAEKTGACLKCLFQPGWERVKFIHHRKQCPKESAWDV